MTDPTPTRAEVEAAVEKLANSHLGMSLVEWNAVSNTILTCAAENQALRERAEAAERAHVSLCEAIGIPATALSHIEYTAQLTAARRAEAAAWNDAIEAAAERIDTETARAQEWLDDTVHDQWSARSDSMLFATVILPKASGAIRALRRAAPTEGEA